MNNRFYSLLGLCQKAGRLKSGEFQTENAVKDGSARLVIIAEDSSDNTKKKFKDMCSFHNKEYIEAGTKETLGLAIGKELRSSLAVCDDGFANSLKNLSDGFRKTTEEQ